MPPKPWMNTDYEKIISKQDEDMRSANFNYKPMFEIYHDYIEMNLGNFTLFALEAGWDCGVFTFHFALLGVHFGRSVGIDNT